MNNQREQQQQTDPPSSVLILTRENRTRDGSVHACAFALSIVHCTSLQQIYHLVTRLHFSGHRPQVVVDESGTRWLSESVLVMQAGPVDRGEAGGMCSQ